MSEVWYCAKCANPVDPAIVITSADSAGRIKLVPCPTCRTEANPYTAAVPTLPPDRRKRTRRVQAKPDDIWLPGTSFAARLPGQGLLDDLREA
jgi:hypothetical protein